MQGSILADSEALADNFGAVALTWTDAPGGKSLSRLRHPRLSVQHLSAIPISASKVIVGMVYL
jgi:hypothetical protein